MVAGQALDVVHYGRCTNIEPVEHLRRHVMILRTNELGDPYDSRLAHNRFSLKTLPHDQRHCIGAAEPYSSAKIDALRLNM
jgi:hypothetical protein